MLNWSYPSNYVDGFIIERSIDQSDKSDNKKGWTVTGEVDKNATNVYTYIDARDSDSIFYYRVIAFKCQVSNPCDEKNRIKSEPSNLASAKLPSLSKLSSSMGDDNSGDVSAEEGSSSGGAPRLFGCGLSHGGMRSGIDIPVQILILFLPLFILRRHILRRQR
jgi:hypothetical protein